MDIIFAIPGYLQRFVLPPELSTQLVWTEFPTLLMNVIAKKVLITVVICAFVVPFLVPSSRILASMYGLKDGVSFLVFMTCLPCALPLWRLTGVEVTLLADEVNSSDE